MSTTLGLTLGTLLISGLKCAVWVETLLLNERKGKEGGWALSSIKTVTDFDNIFTFVVFSHLKMNKIKHIYF